MIFRHRSFIYVSILSLPTRVQTKSHKNFLSTASPWFYPPYQSLPAYVVSPCDFAKCLNKIAPKELPHTANIQHYLTLAIKAPAIELCFAKNDLLIVRPQFRSTRLPPDIRVHSSTSACQVSFAIWLSWLAPFLRRKTSSGVLRMHDGHGSSTVQGKTREI